MITFYEVIKKVLLANREIAIRHDTDNNMVVVSVTAFNKAQNIKMCHSYKIEGDKIPDEEELAHILHILEENVASKH